jgi:hypothetical protein
MQTNSKAEDLNQLDGASAYYTRVERLKSSNLLAFSLGNII